MKSKVFFSEHSRIDGLDQQRALTDWNPPALEDALPGDGCSISTAPSPPLCVRSIAFCLSLSLSATQREMVEERHACVSSCIWPAFVSESTPETRGGKSHCRTTPHGSTSASWRSVLILLWDLGLNLDCRVVFRRPLVAYVARVHAAKCLVCCRKECNVQLETRRSDCHATEIEGWWMEQVKSLWVSLMIRNKLSRLQIWSAAPTGWVRLLRSGGFSINVI